MNGPIDSAADIRAMAKWLRQIYLALHMEGFTEVMRDIVTVVVISLILAIVSGLLVWAFLMLMRHFGILW